MKDTSPMAIQQMAYLMGLQGKLRKDKFVSLCPFHKEKSPSFGIYATQGKIPRYHCFGCGVSGNLLGLFYHLVGTIPVSLHGKILHELLEAKAKPEESLSSFVYTPFATKAAYQPIEQKVKRVAATPKILAQGFREVEEEHVVSEEDLLAFRQKVPDYFVNRGYDVEYLMGWDCYENPKDYRAILTIRDWEGELKGWSGRLYMEQPICVRCHATLTKGLYKPCAKCGHTSPKWLHSKGIDRNHVLYGEHRFQTGQIPMLVEGFFDVWTPARWQSSLGPLAIMGASPGHSQIERVLKHTETYRSPVVTMGDNDAAGKSMNREVIKLVKEIDPSRGVVVVSYAVERKDPGELSEGEVRRLEGLVLGEIGKARRGEIVTVTL